MREVWWKYVTFQSKRMEKKGPNLQVICPECKTVQPIESNFCANCGATLDKAQVVKVGGPALLGVVAGVTFAIAGSLEGLGLVIVVLLAAILFQLSSRR